MTQPLRSQSGETNCDSCHMGSQEPIRRAHPAHPEVLDVGSPGRSAGGGGGDGRRRRHGTRTGTERRVKTGPRRGVDRRVKAATAGDRRRCNRLYSMLLWCGLRKGGLQICTSRTPSCARTYSRQALQDHYQVLGVKRNATSGEIKNAFFSLSKKCHPDSDPSNPLLHARFVRINEAYNVLGKSSSRREYDQILETLQRGWAYPEQSRRRTSTNGPSATRAYREKEEPYSWSKAESESFYWSQFHPEPGWEEPVDKRRQRNRRIVWGCIFGCLTSIYLHFIIFSALREIRNKELEAEQQRIINFYNMTRENALMNGFSKQQEILLQKHEERLKKLYGREDVPK